MLGWSLMILLMKNIFHRSVLSIAGLSAGAVISFFVFFLLNAPIVQAQVVQQQTVSTKLAHKPNSLVRDGQTIFLIGKGYKQGFVSLNEFLTYKYRISRIITANSGDKALPEGQPMRAKAGSLVLDSSDRKTVYLIGKQGEKRGLATSAAYWRYKKPKTILWSIDLSRYPTGDIIE